MFRVDSKASNPVHGCWHSTIQGGERGVGGGEGGHSPQYNKRKKAAGGSSREGRGEWEHADHNQQRSKPAARHSDP